LSSFNFTSRLVGICGMNGVGKTNLLDAINYLCFSKSYFSRTDSINVENCFDGFRVEGEFEKKHSVETDKVICTYRNTSKKELYLNDVLYEKFSKHIGKFPCVVIAPDDIEIIAGSSDERRRFIDTVLSQMSPGYLQQLITYNKILLQRNSLLKNFTGSTSDNLLLDVLDKQLLEPATNIFLLRTEFSEALIPLVKDFYLKIAGTSENVDMIYESLLTNADFAILLTESRPKDILLQRTTTGIHKDDLGINLDGRSFKNLASQGQRKSFLFALKLAEFEILKANKGFAPLLLLDDVFEKLDDNRMGNLLQWICINNQGQVFITDTQKQRLHDFLTQFSTDVQIIELN
ncbi:MAG: DNA replication and repair protein RecF, partial [Ginsengibacter sp.]